MAVKYTQTQDKNRREVVRMVDGEEVTFIRFKGVLRYAVPNPDFVEKPKGVDTRTAKQKRRKVWKEISKMLEAEKVTKGRGQQKQTEENITNALNAWRDEMERDANMPTEAGKTVVDFVKEFVATKKNSRNGATLAATTRDTYRYALRHIDREELRKPIKSINVRDVNAWLNALEKDGVGRSIANKSFRLLNQAMKSAVKLGYTPANPCDNIGVDEGKPVAPRPKVNALDMDGLKRLNALLDLQEHSQMADCARMALLCGMREGEICGLRLKDIDGWRDGSYGDLHVTNVISRTSAGEENKPCPKNGKERAIHINKPMAELISYRVAHLRKEAADVGIILKDTEYLFGTVTGIEGMGFMSVGYLSKIWGMFAESNRIVGAKGFKCTFHALRHTYATIMLTKGAKPENVAQVLGHSDPSITQRIYFEYIPKGTDEVQELAAGLMTMNDAVHPNGEGDVYQLKTGTTD